MTDNTELKRAAERIVEVQTSQDVPIGILFDEFEALASPEAILALIAENERLAAQARLAGVSAEMTVHQAVGRAATEALLVMHERDQLKAENEALRKDAERYRRVRTAALKQDDVLADEFDAEFDLHLDAALGKEVRS